MTEPREINVSGPTRFEINHWPTSWWRNAELGRAWGFGLIVGATQGVILMFLIGWVISLLFRGAGLLR